MIDQETGLLIEATPTNPELAQIKEAMDRGAWPEAIALSDAYVEAHPEEFVDYHGKSRDQVIHWVQGFRENEMPDHQYRSDAWIFHTWELHDGTSAAAPLRVHN